MKNILFTDNAWEEYCYWQQQDRKTIKRINQLLKEIMRDNFNGLGKPEPLKGDLSGLWSRRIDSENRLIYRVKEKHIEIIQCKNHYNNK